MINRKITRSFLMVLALTAICRYSNGQEVLQELSGLYGTYFDSTTRTHYQFFKDSVASFRLDDSKPDTGFHIAGVGELIPNYSPVVLKGELLLVNKAGGMVIRVSPSGLERIDNSFDHRMQSGSLIFTLRDTLFRHGGYGLWSARREICYFDYSTKEWELYKLSLQTEIPPAAFGHLATVRNNKLTIFSGATIDPKDPLTVKSFQEVWQLDFTTKKWQYIGKLKEGISSVQWPHSSYPFGDKILHFDKNITYSLVESERNLVVTYQGNPVYLQIVLNPSIFPVLLDSQVYFYRVKMLHESSKPVNEINLELCRMPLKGFLLQETSRNSFLAEDRFWSIKVLVITSSLLLIALVALLYRTRKKSIRKVQLNPSGIKCGKNQIKLSEHELAVILLLLQAKADITTNDILEITSNPNLDYTQNLRLKNQLIDKLNEHFRALLEIEDEVIVTDRSETDRRIKRYRIQREHFETIA